MNRVCLLLLRSILISCQELKSPNTPSKVVFQLRMHHKNNPNVLSGLVTYWSRLLWVHCWFEYNVGAPWLQVTGHSLYSKSDPIIIFLEPYCNLDCGSKAYTLITNNNPSLIVWRNINVIFTSRSTLLSYIDTTVHLRWKVTDQFNLCFWSYFCSYVIKYIVTHKPYIPHCTQSQSFYLTICTSSAI